MTWASVSTLLTSVGIGRVARGLAGFGFGRAPAQLRRSREQAVLERRQDAGERVVAFDHFEHRLLFTEQVLVGATRDRDVEVAEQAGRRELAGRALERLELADERRLHADVHVVRADGERGDRGTGHDLIRVAPHDRAVLERARLAFGAVCHDELAAPARVAHGAPLATGRETAAAAPAQSRRSSSAMVASGPSSRARSRARSPSRARKSSRVATGEGGRTRYRRGTLPRACVRQIRRRRRRPRLAGTRIRATPHHGAADRYLRVAVPRLARPVLSDRGAVDALARALRGAVRDGRGEQHVLPTARARARSSSGAGACRTTSSSRSRRAATSRTTSGCANPKSRSNDCSTHARPLGEHLGPVLLQLPPDLPAGFDALDATLRAFGARVRVAVEPRHASWFGDELRDVLTRHDAALCLADRGSRPITPLWRTASWCYVRFHAGRRHRDPATAPTRSRRGRAPRRAVVPCRRLRGRRLRVLQQRHRRLCRPRRDRASRRSADPSRDRR